MLNVLSCGIPGIIALPTDRQVWLVSRCSLGTTNTAARDQRSGQNLHPDQLTCVTFWKQLFTYEIIRIAIAMD